MVTRVCVLLGFIRTQNSMAHTRDGMPSPPQQARDPGKPDVGLLKFPGERGEPVKGAGQVTEPSAWGRRNSRPYEPAARLRSHNFAPSAPAPGPDRTPALAYLRFDLLCHHHQLHGSCGVWFAGADAADQDRVE